MKRSTVNAMVGSALALGLVGCTEADGTLQILQNQVPGDGCVISSTVSDTFYGRGTIDVNAALGYIFNPVIRSRAQGSGGEASRTTYIEGYEIDIKFTDDTYDRDYGDLTNYSGLVSATVEAGGTVGMSFVAIPKDLLNAMGVPAGSTTTVVVEVTIFGTMDGGEVTSNRFTYPVDVCNGCLTQSQGSCTLIPNDFSPRTGGVCNLLQDAVIDCCTSSGGATVCPAAREETQL